MTDITQWISDAEARCKSYNNGIPSIIGAYPITREDLPRALKALRGALEYIDNVQRQPLSEYYSIREKISAILEGRDEQN